MATIAAQIGSLGERAATKWLRNHGYLIHALNWRAGRYELDIVAERWDIIHFVEVKSRKADGLTTPEEAMTKEKFASISKAARAYMAQYNLRKECQFDLAAVDVMQNGEVEVRLIEHVMEFRW